MSYDHAASARHTTAGAMPKAPKPQQLDPKARELLERCARFLELRHTLLSREIDDYLKGLPK